VQGFDKYKDDALKKVEGYVEGVEVCLTSLAMPLCT
jgi:hypothetical protein